MASPAQTGEGAGSPRRAVARPGSKKGSPGQKGLMGGGGGCGFFHFPGIGAKRDKGWLLRTSFFVSAWRGSNFWLKAVACIFVSVCPGDKQ